jgi:hypothetical protein
MSTRSYVEGLRPCRGLEAVRRSRSSVKNWKVLGEDYNPCVEREAMKRTEGFWRTGGFIEE